MAVRLGFAELLLLLFAVCAAEGADLPSNVSPRVAELLQLPRRILPEELASISDSELSVAFRALGGTTFGHDFSAMERIGADLMRRVERAFDGYPRDRSNVRIYVAGAGMEPFYSYASLLGGRSFTADQFVHFPVSRALRKSDPEAFQKFVTAQLANDIREGRQIVILDTVGTGETFNNLRVEIARAGAVLERPVAPVFLALPEAPGLYGGATPVKTVASALASSATPHVVDLGYLPEIQAQISNGPRTIISASHFEGAEPRWKTPDQPMIQNLILRERVKGMRYLRHLMGRAHWLGSCSPSRLRRVLLRILAE